MKRLTSVLICMLVLCSYQLTAQTLPSGFSKANIGSGWNQPVGAAFTKEGTQLFVWEKGGKVFLCKWNSSTHTYTKQTTPVINISPEVGDWRDHGLLGFALDPDFDTNGYIYLLYVVDGHYLFKFGTSGYSSIKNEYFTSTIGRVTRYQTINDNGKITADPNTRTILIGETKSTGIPILYESHGVGSLAFAADKTLLVSAGDGASYSNVDTGSIGVTYYSRALSEGIIRDEENVGSFRAQLLNSMNGKILRIDPATGDGISSNPFFQSSSPRSPQSRVWALGFRNPFRFSIKPNTGSLSASTGDIGEIYIGDVGWDFVEEFDIIKKSGTNYGWPVYEGLSTVWGYETASTLNRDDPNPQFGNGCTQQFFPFIKLLRQPTVNNDLSVLNATCGLPDFVNTNNGNRFLHNRPALDWKHGQNIARVGIFSGNNAANAVIGTPESNVTGTPFRGNCSIGGCWYTGSAFPDAYRNSYFHADYGAGWIKKLDIPYTDVVTGVAPFASGFVAIVGLIENPLDGSLVYVDAGTNTIGKISFTGNKPPTAILKSDKIFGPSPVTINFQGDESSDPEGGALTYSWDFGDGSTSSDINPSHQYTATGPKKFVATMTVKDNQNSISIDSIIISLNNTPPKVKIQSPAKNTYYRLGADTSYTCRAEVIDDEQTDPGLTYQWQTYLRHNTHEHPEPIDTNRVTHTMISRIGCNGETYYWLIKLTVTDTAGLSSSDSVVLTPNCNSNSAVLALLPAFSVVAQPGGNLVKWTISEGADLSSFSVERSEDGHQFIPIYQEDTQGGNDEISYQYLDANVPAGDNYYRLRMEDLSHGYHYSVTIKVITKVDRKDQLIIIPNPVQREFILGGFFSQDGNVDLKITDYAGRVVQTIAETVNAGFNNMLVRLPGQIPDGFYILEVRENGQVRQTKLVKIN